MNTQPIECINSKCQSILYVPAGKSHLPLQCEKCQTAKCLECCETTSAIELDKYGGICDSCSSEILE